MKHLSVFASLFFCLFAVPAGVFAQDEPSKSIDERIDGALEPISKITGEIIFFEIPLGNGLGVPIVLVLLAGTAVFLTLYFKFINIRAFGLALKTVQGKLTDQNAPGEISHFQALSAALSATVGLGNIAGVAIAISLGGPGAVFWMVMMGLCGMTSKFCECTLGVKYRVIDAKGRVSGGAMYYLSRGLAEKGAGGLGKVLAVLFAIFCVGGAIGAGNMFQVNQAYSQFSKTTGLLQDQAWIFGLVVAIIVGAVIIGGIVGIARVTSKLVPFMCGMYVIAALVIVFANLGEVPAALGRIISEAFTPSAALSGGIVMVLIQGIKRAAFSNEAGVGSAPIAHAAVRTDKPASEGLVALLEPFIDTVVVCTLTALVILVTGTYDANLGKDGLDGIALTSEAFGSVIPWFPIVLMVAVILFAFSTMISWSYYGERAIAYLCGGPKTGVLFAYRLFFCVCTVIGCSMTLSNVVNISDALFFAMVIPNLIGIYVLLPVIKEELNSFVESAKGK